MKYESRLADAYIESFLETNGISWQSVQRRAPVWKTAKGKIPLTIEQIETLIGIEDPVAWMYMNLVEFGSYRNGQPWALFPVQAEMARMRGDMIFECGAAIGKTRDLEGRSLWWADTAHAGGSVMIVSNAAQTQEVIWNEVIKQIEDSVKKRRGALGFGIGGGIRDKGEKPLRFIDFNNGFHFEMRITGDDGEQLRGAHIDNEILGDEAAEWKKTVIFDELWRAANPGCKFRIYTTPKGDYGSPYFNISARAMPIGSTAAGAQRIKAVEADAGDEEVALPGATPVEFRKFWIPRTSLPPPFWDEKAEAAALSRYLGRDTIGWQRNILGKWGDPEYSVFPFSRLKEVLRYPSDFRFVAVTIDSDTKIATMVVSQPESDGDAAVTEMDGRELIVARETLGFRDLPKAIAAWYPEPTKNEILHFGCDIGIDADPTEILNSVKGVKVRDRFRLYVKRADYTLLRDIVLYLDHASGHSGAWALDRGNAGGALTEMIGNVNICPVAECRSFPGERVLSFSFSGNVDAIDYKTGALMLNPDTKDEKNPKGKPFRVSNKEFSTRVIERWIQDRECEIAWDGGAGDPRIAGPRLMVNHTYRGGKKNGERFFSDTDDHYIDARRQLALSIMFGFRGVTALPSLRTNTNVAAVSRKTGVDSAAVAFGVGRQGVGSDERSILRRSNIFGGL